MQMMWKAWRTMAEERLDRKQRAIHGKLEHRQVGSSSVTFNQGSSVLLIPLDISFEPANSESVVQYYQLPDKEFMMKRYSENRGIPEQSQIFTSICLHILHISTRSQV